MAWYSNGMDKTDAQSKAIHAKAKMGKKDELNAWGQDAKTAKSVRKSLKQEKAFKAFNNHAVERHNAGY